ncbi:type II secretion system F family protein [Virgibacillus xinjiangensis]|uniref:Type II secretion system F family protein n=1 Tax=Virgibacillus xinjiangensis TaxID=393090 RepID=A0ABV7D015_9BACI
MKLILFSSLFLTIFFLFLTVAVSVKRREPTTDKNKVTLKDGLKEANRKLTLLLTKNKKKSKKKNNLEQELSTAGIPVKPEEFIAFQWMAAVFLAGLLHLITGNLLFSALGVPIGYMIPKFWLKRKQRIRVEQFNQALPGMITSMVGALRAGFSLPQSLAMVAEESFSPLKEEVELVLKKMRYGASMEEALLEWKERMPSEDLGLMVEAVIIQRQVGGNLAYLLNKIVETIRERGKIQNQIKTLTAQGRLSGMIISLLPVGLGFVIFLINPEYISSLFTNPIGLFMLGVGLIGGIIGFVLIRKITTIEV